jgi:hypothetical protein
MFPVRYELGFYIPEDGILQSHRHENLSSCNLDASGNRNFPTELFQTAMPSAVTIHSTDRGTDTMQLFMGAAAGDVLLMLQVYQSAATGRPTGTRPVGEGERVLHS